MLKKVKMFSSLLLIGASFVVIENGQELGRLVNKDRKTKEEISAFLTSLG